MTYIPRPIDTTEVQLSRGLQGLTERLAAHIHDVWAARRIDEGWRYGPRRDDERKTHPGLVPYSELPESEKDYDRRTALGAVKAIVALGYEILPPEVE